MRLIMSGINGQYLRDITENRRKDTEEVLAAVAYASDASLIFDWCWQHKIPLKYYGRLDESVAVSVPILQSFLNRKSRNYVCRLVEQHHAKVIWWRGVGVYIGSANLSGRAWYSNVEAGCFFDEDEINVEMNGDLSALFALLETNGTPLTEEVLGVMKRRLKALENMPDAADFWKTPGFRRWPGVVQTGAQTAKERKRRRFLKEWYETLQDLRDIGSRISRPENRPQWIHPTSPAGAQADQFLHAHYYAKTFDGNRALYADKFEENKSRREEALIEAMEWWSRLPVAPHSEDTMLNEHAPFLQTALSEHELAGMNEDAFRLICVRVHAIKEHATRASNMSVGLPDGSPYTMEQKVAALARRIWNDRSGGGYHVSDLLRYTLYGGASEELPQRLWEAVMDPKWKIRGLGISGLGEAVGWALPDRFPPRNGRTSKALRSLGYNVEIHVE